MTLNKTNKIQKLPALTSARFLAAFWVLLYHSVPVIAPNLNDGLTGTVSSLGYVSVSFFFLLSGYILALVYLSGRHSVGYLSFYKARFARIYPLYFVTLVLDAPNLLWFRVQHYGTNAAILKTAATFLAATFMLQSWVMAFRGIDNPNWSLAVEAVFYFLFPFIGLQLWKLRGLRLYLAALLLYVAGQAFAHLAGGHWSDSQAKFTPILHVSTFVLGILLARWQSLRRNPDHYPVWPGLLALSALALLAIRPNSLPLINLYDGLLAPLFACLIFTLSGSSSSILRSKWLETLGEASFGLYLIHLPVLHVFIALGWVGGALPLLALYIAISVALSLASFYYFEIPTRAWILGRTTKPVESVEMSSAA